LPARSDTSYIGRSHFEPAKQLKETAIMKISARNRIKGKIVDVKKGATTAHVKIDVGGGQIITSSITNESVDELALAVGKSVYAVIKASDVMIGVD
jgi:molybdopterin-binding protein